MRLPLLGVETAALRRRGGPKTAHSPQGQKAARPCCGAARQRQKAARINRDGLHPAIHAHGLAGHLPPSDADTHAKSARLPLPRPDAGGAATHRGRRRDQCNKRALAVRVSLDRDARPEGAACSSHPPALAAGRSGGGRRRRPQKVRRTLSGHIARGAIRSPRVRRGRHGPEVWCCAT